MIDPQAPLKELKSGHEFLIAIDSDGCVFDSMEIKQKECFTPNTIKCWKLQPVSKYTRTAAEFVNLYSKWRGSNRFPALVKVFDLLMDWPEVRKRNVEIPVAQPFRDWIARESKLGNPALTAEVERTGDPVLKQVLTWSNAVNSAIKDMVFGIPPFPLVRESLEKISKWADIIVCSGTPGEALEREWKENDIDGFPLVIAGQEMGKKKDHLKLVKDKYPEGNVIMIGDAPGDMKAAKANNLLFFPVNPGLEENSWELFHNEAADKFHSGEYTKEYEEKLISVFDKLLPETPPWKSNVPGAH
ncbi:MAG: HAD family hydrolase [Candidatus Latescibacteria bacterium]|jgi:phosphoglycolate phosphatase-like HAD superfamily hydrolase|nr:HAD family hydrolase [Candidatus Latescibacterota bacterium]